MMAFQVKRIYRRVTKYLKNSKGLFISDRVSLDMRFALEMFAN